MEHSDLKIFVLVASQSSWQNIRQNGCQFFSSVLLIVYYMLQSLSRAKLEKQNECYYRSLISFKIASNCYYCKNGFL